MEAASISSAVTVNAAGVAPGASSANSGAACGSFFQLVASAMQSVSAPVTPGGEGGLAGSCVPGTGAKPTAKNSSDQLCADRINALAASLTIAMAMPVVLSVSSTNAEITCDPPQQESVTAPGDRSTTDLIASVAEVAGMQTKNTARVSKQNDGISLLKAALERDIAPRIQANAPALSDVSSVGQDPQLLTVSGTDGQLRTQTAPGQSSNLGQMNSAVKALAEQTLELQKTGIGKEIKLEKIPVIEILGKRLTSRMDLTGATDTAKKPVVNPSIPLPAPTSEQAQLNEAVLKTERSSILTSAEKGLEVSSVTALQEEPAERQSAKENPGDGDRWGSQEVDAPGVSESAANFAKPFHVPAEPQDSAPQPDRPQAAVQAVNLLAPTPTNSPVNQDQSISPTQPATPGGNSRPNYHAADEPMCKVVNSAQIAEAANHTEMRIAMQNDKLGNIELRAHVEGEIVGAAITVEKRDTHSALAVELPILQQALSEKSLHVAEVTLFQGMLDSGDGQNGNETSQQDAQQMLERGKGWPAESNGTSMISAEFVQSGVFDSSGRLNVRA